jgi:diaminopimelate epimerase
VCLEPLPVSALPELAIALCDRRRGIGADGLLSLTDPADGADLGMILHNADGSPAEMSGNGIRCFVQAWVHEGGSADDSLLISTDAGIREVAVAETDRADTVMVSVSMGPVSVTGPPVGWADLGVDGRRPVAHLSLGNPHTVVAVEDVDLVPLADLGARVPGTNLEIVEAGPEPDAITMRVHERGAGITEACGTGACAAAHAAATWGLVSPDLREITVHMEGGDARVRLGDELVLVGPATFIASIEVDT